MVTRAPALRGWLVVLVGGVLAGVLVVAVTGLFGTGGADLHAPGPVRAVADRDPAPSPSPSAAHDPATDVLHRWDRDRARAWAAGDAAALGRLYAAGSPAGAADVALLRRYLARGLVVIGMRRQVLGVRVLEAPTDRLRLVVTDRLVGAEARPVAGGPTTALPASRPMTRTLLLRRTHGEWRMAGVSAR